MSDMLTRSDADDQEREWRSRSCESEGVPIVVLSFI